jgi:hypothetical protein
MKFSAFVVALGLPLLGLVAADFHVVDDGSGILLACPSNYYKCDCFSNRKRAQFVENLTPLGQYFELTAGFCGISKKLDFYRRSDMHYDFYQNNGDGTVQGTCWYNTDAPGVKCGFPPATVREQLVCYSYICK